MFDSSVYFYRDDSIASFYFYFVVETQFINERSNMKGRIRFRGRTPGTI